MVAANSVILDVVTVEIKVEKFQIKSFSQRIDIRYQITANKQLRDASSYLYNVVHGEARHDRSYFEQIRVITNLSQLHQAVNDA